MVSGYYQSGIIVPGETALNLGLAQRGEGPPPDEWAPYRGLVWLDFTNYRVYVADGEKWILRAGVDFEQVYATIKHRHETITPANISPRGSELGVLTRGEVISRGDARGVTTSTDTLSLARADIAVEGVTKDQQQFVLYPASWVLMITMVAEHRTNAARVVFRVSELVPEIVRGPEGDIEDTQQVSEETLVQETINRTVTDSALVPASMHTYRRLLIPRPATSILQSHRFINVFTEVGRETTVRWVCRATEMRSYVGPAINDVEEA